METSRKGGDGRGEGGDVCLHCFSCPYLFMVLRGWRPQFRISNTPGGDRQVAGQSRKYQGSHLLPC